MRTIWRFPIDMGEAALNEGRFTIEAPLGARILHVDVLQRAPHEPSMWVLLDEERAPLKRTFEIVGTGHSTPLDASQHVATWQQEGFVWHLFELGPAEPASAEVD